MNLPDHMRIFVFVAKFNGFAAAAKELNLTLPTVRRSISTLEGHLNAELLTRASRHVALTNAGRDFFQKCSKILVGVDEAIHMAIDSNIRPEGHIRIHASNEIGKRYLLPTIADYRRFHPSVTFDLVLDNRFLDRMKDDIDVPISLQSLEGEQLVSRNIGATYSVTCASRAYLANRSQPKVPEDLARHECLNPLEEATSAQDIWSFQGPDGEVNVYLAPSCVHLNSRDAILDAARAGLGIGCIPAFTVADYLNDGELIRVLPDYHLESSGIHAVYPDRLSSNVCVRSWINYLGDSLPRRLAAALHEFPA